MQSDTAARNIFHETTHGNTAYFLRVTCHLQHGSVKRMEEQQDSSEVHAMEMLKSDKIEMLGFGECFC